MGNKTEKRKEPQYIQAKELFTVQVCPDCNNYLTVVALGRDGHGPQLKLSCLGESCDYISTRILI